MSDQRDNEGDLQDVYDVEENCNHSDALSDNVSRMLENKDYSDVTFTIDGKQFLCHKVILASQSTYFDAMFKSPLTNSHEIEITTVPHHIFEGVIRFLYTGKVTVKENEMEQLLEAADMMDLEALKNTLAIHCEKNFDTSNCLDYYTMGSRYQAKGLMKSSMEYSEQNFDSVKQTERFKEQHLETISDYLQNHKIKTYSEDEICTAAIEWMLHSPEERIPQFYDIVDVIRVENLTANYIHHYIQGLICNPPSVISEGDDELTNDFRSALLHICSLSANPMTIRYRFPRTQTSVVTGVASIKFGYDENIVEFYRYLSNSSLKSHKVNKCKFDNRQFNPKSCVTFKNNIVCLSAFQLLTYHTCQNAMTACDAPSFAKILVCNDAEMYVGSFLQMSHNLPSLHAQVCRYNMYDQTKWIEEYQSPNLASFDLKVHEHCKATLYNKKIYIWGVRFNSNRACNNILVLDIDEKQSKLLNTKLPQEFSNMQVVQYKTCVLIAGMDMIWKCDMTILEQDFEEQQPLAEDTLVQNSANFTGGQAISVIVQFSSHMRNFHMVRLGNMLLLLGGSRKRNETWEPYRVIYHANIDEMISNREGQKWEPIGTLGNHNVDSIVPLTFDI